MPQKDAETTNDKLIQAFKDPEEGKYLLRRTIEATAAFIMGLIEHDADNQKLINTFPEVFMTEVSKRLLTVRTRPDVDRAYVSITAALKKAHG